MRTLLAAFFASAGLAAAVPTDAQVASPAALTVERVAALPSLIGTAPASPTWSPDSRWLAFRWNDAGWPFRDLWIVAADGTGLRRLTDLQRTHPQPPAPGGAGRGPRPRRHQRDPLDARQPCRVVRRARRSV
jgi:hypothetical protein